MSQTELSRWGERVKQLEDGIAWIERHAPGRAYEIEEMRERLAETQAKMRELGKRPSSPITFADRVLLSGQPA